MALRHDEDGGNVSLLVEDDGLVTLVCGKCDQLWEFFADPVETVLALAPAPRSPRPPRGTTARRKATGRKKTTARRKTTGRKKTTARRKATGRKKATARRKATRR